MSGSNVWAAWLVGATAIAFGGCGTPILPVDPAPTAKAAAVERARNDLNCDKISAEILSEKPPGASVYDIDRREYQVQVRGCGKRTTYTVACNKFAACSALAERAIIERGE